LDLAGARTRQVYPIKEISMPKKTIILMTLALLLAACLPAAQPTDDIQSQINTAVAQTMEIDNLVAQNVQQTLTSLVPAASPTPLSTSTPEPTFEAVTLITDTPFPLPAPQTEAPLFIGPTATEVKFSCYVTTLKPKGGTEVNRKQDFDIVWIIVNTGARPILAGTDFKFSGGINMANANRVEISTTVNTGESYRVELDGNAPDEKGVKYMAWKLASPVCYGEVYITVK
jgi:hypothetical protein